MASLQSQSSTITKVLMAEAIRVFKQEVQPSLVPIYAGQKGNANNPVQIGTGFLVLHDSQQHFITAKHVLRGNTLTEDPASRAVHVDRGWSYIGGSSRRLVEAGSDLAIAFMPEFPKSRCLPEGCVVAQPYTPSIVTFAGFLARDFKRSKDVLRPAPKSYSNVGVPLDQVSSGYATPTAGTLTP